MKEYEVLLPMALVLKNILSSYRLVLLLVYFLRIKEGQGQAINMNNVGKLFYEFLVFYSS